MNRNPRPDQTPIDDGELSRLVKDVAADWTMPAVRLDEAGWRERLRAQGRRPGFSISPWLRRFAGAFGVAVVLTVVVALLGVWLALPRANQIGKPGDTPTPTAAPSSNSSTSSHPTPTPAAPSASGLPALLVDGSLPSPSKLVVQLDDGSFAVADLASGKLGQPFGGGRGGSAVRRAPDGSLYCVCISYTAMIGGTPTQATAYFNRYDADGKQLSSTKLDEFAGQPDPRDPIMIPAEPEHVRATASFSGDARYAFVGWSARAHPVWHNGLVVVDVTTGKVAGRVDFADTTDGDGDTRRFTDAPVIVGSNGSSLLIGRNYYTFGPASSRNPNFALNSDAFTYQLAIPINPDTQLDSIAAADGCGDYIETAGFTAGGGTWLACPTDAGGVNVRRIAADGTASDTLLSGAGGIDGTTLAASPDGTYLYDWDPIGLTLTRVDLATGKMDSATGPKPAAVFDPLRAIARWLVLSAQAKMLLKAGIAVSSDGTHVYTLGVDRSGTSEFGGSAGLFDFDVAGAAMNVQRWDPTADFVSVAVSSDGRFVYAAGMPTADSSNAPVPPFASVTVYDTATGKVRLIAGQLGFAQVTFEQANLPLP